MIELPPALENAWHTHGYYGSVSHNVKAIYQRYMGWFDGNPAHLWEHPPVEAAMRYVDFMGGADAVVDKARAAFDAGRLPLGRRGASTTWCSPIPSNAAARDAAGRHLRAARLRRGERHLAQLLPLRRHGTARRAVRHADHHGRAGHLIGQLTPDMLFDAIAIQVNGPAAFDEKLTIDVVLTDIDKRYRLRLANGVLTYSAAAQKGDGGRHRDHHQPGAACPGARGGVPEKLADAGIALSGDASVLGRLVAVLDPGDPNFAIVTP